MDQGIRKKVSINKVQGKPKPKLDACNWINPSFEKQKSLLITIWAPQSGTKRHDCFFPTDGCAIQECQRWLFFHIKYSLELLARIYFSLALDPEKLVSLGPSLARNFLPIAISLLTSNVLIGNMREQRGPSTIKHQDKIFVKPSNSSVIECRKRWWCIEIEFTKFCIVKESDHLLSMQHWSREKAAKQQKDQFTTWQKHVAVEKTRNQSFRKLTTEEKQSKF